MKRTLRTVSLLGALISLLGLMVPRPVLATPLPPPIRPFAGSFHLDSGQVVQIQGFVHLNVSMPSPPPIVPPNPSQIRIHTNLANTFAVNATTGQRYVGTGSGWVEGAVIPTQLFPFSVGYRLLPMPPPIHQGQPNPPPILPLNLGFDAVLHLDGSLQVLNVTVLPPIPPTGDS